MELALFFYFAGIVDTLAKSITLFSLSVGIFWAFVYGIKMMNADVESSWKGDEPKERVREGIKRTKSIPIIASILLFLACFIPNRETMYTMAAAYGVQQVATNPDVQRVAGKSVQLLERTIDKYLKEGVKHD